MSAHEYSVQFRIYSETLDWSEVTRTLGVAPCQVRSEVGYWAIGCRRKDRMWAFDGGDGHMIWESFEEGLEFVLSKLWPSRESIARYKAGGKLTWWCGHFQSSFDGGPTLSPQLLTRLGEFGVELYIDNYFTSKNEEADDQ